MLLTVSKPLESHKLKPVLINLMSRGPGGTHSMELFELVELMRPISCMIKFMIFLMQSFAVYLDQPAHHMSKWASHALSTAVGDHSS